jgi:hypothetical protein
MNSKYDTKYDTKCDTNILKLILSFNNVNSLHISNNINEKQICVLMAKNNELRKINWVNEFKMKVEKKIHNEKCKQKLDNVLIKLLNHINFIFQNEQISFPDNDIIYINSNALYFYIDITNYGVFLITIINDNNIWIHNICEPEHILDEEFIIDPNNITYQCIILNSDYYLKKTFKKGTINEIINAIWFTPFWKKRMPDNNNYILTY